MENESKWNRLLGEAQGIRPVLLGRKFRLKDTGGIYVVLGIKGRSGALVLEEETTGEVRIINTPEEFTALATRADT